jgi:hypothetical protein
MITCGKREFQTWKEASVFIEEFKQREKERREIAFYCWHNIEDETIKENIVNISTEKIFNDVMEYIDLNLSKEIHAGHRLPFISFDSQEEKEVTVN